MKKKLMFILPSMEQGGAERVITILINELQNDFDITLLLFKKEGYYLKILPENLKIININVPQIKKSLFPILKILRKEKPHIIFGGWGEVSVLLAFFIPFFPKIRFIARETNIVSQHVTRKEIKFLYKFYNRFHTIIAQSNDMKLDLIENFNIVSSKVQKINNPVDFELIDEKLKEKINLPFQSNKKNVVAVGNLAHRKGFDLLLNVFKQLKDKNVHLYILGDGANKEELLKQKETLKLTNVHFLGKVNNPFVYMQKADLFILSSRYEGFPNVLLEAGACGTYALVNNCKGGINEIIEPNINGEIMNIEDSYSFAQRIEQILIQPPNKIIIRNSIYNRFNKEKIIEQYRKVLMSQ